MRFRSSASITSTGFHGVPAECAGAIQEKRSNGMLNVAQTYIQTILAQILLCDQIEPQCQGSRQLLRSLWKHSIQWIFARHHRCVHTV